MVEPHVAEPAAVAGACVAFLRDDGVRECERCAKAWEDGEEKPACSAVTYARLRAAADEAAHRIEQNQRAMLAAELIKHRDQALLTLAMELRAIVRLVDKIRPPPSPPLERSPGYVRVGMKDKPEIAKEGATDER